MTHMTNIQKQNISLGTLARTYQKLFLSILFHFDSTVLLRPGKTPRSTQSKSVVVVVVVVVVVIIMQYNEPLPTILSAVN